MKHDQTTTARSPGGLPRAAAAFTLVELLVAATLAFVVMAALASLFGIFGRTVADSRELIQLGARMRSAAWRLRQDLQGLTTDVKPFIRPESASGYLEIVEGPLIGTGTTMVGDVDDILMLTTASPGRPFTGLLSGTGCLESTLAEVAWFCKQAPPTGDGLQLFNLYRRQLLVAAAPAAGDLQTANTTAFTSWDTFFLNNDLSARREGGLLVANSLADLTRRQSRFMHNLSGSTTPVTRDTWPQITITSTVSGMSDTLTGARQGEDLLLTNVIAFDVRVFDPAQAGGGAYVDLGGGTPGATATQLSGTITVTGTGVPPGMRMVPASSTFPANAFKLYDTWGLHSEWNNLGDAIDNAGSTVSNKLDNATNWIDNNANGVVDDAAEMELAHTRPTAFYNVPLRGIEIRIRCYEPASQEVRQITVQHSFLAR